MNRYMVRLWKFDQHSCREREVYVMFNPAYIPKKDDPSLLGNILSLIQAALTERRQK
jgi:hypothetical protein